jgi:hypothetical protein
MGLVGLNGPSTHRDLSKNGTLQRRGDTWAKVCKLTEPMCAGRYNAAAEHLILWGNANQASPWRSPQMFELVFGLIAFAFSLVGAAIGLVVAIVLGSLGLVSGILGLLM